MKRGLTQMQLAQAMGWNDRGAISSLEYFRRKASLEQSVLFSNFFGVSVTTLLSNSQQNQYGLRYPAKVDYQKQVGQNVRQIMREKDLSMDRFVSEMRSHELFMYFRSLHGELISVDRLMAFSTVLGVSVEDLLWSPQRKTVYSNEVVSPNIRLVREELGMSQVELAERVANLGSGITSKQGICDIERGRNTLTVTLLMAIAAGLGTTVKTLLTPSSQQHSELVTPFSPKWEAPQTAELKRNAKTRTSTQVYYDRRMGQNLKYLRNQEGMSQRQLAKKLRTFGPIIGKNALSIKTALSIIEAGEYSPKTDGGFRAVSTDFLMAVATVFAKGEGVTPVEFAETLLTKRLWKLAE